MTFEKLGYVRIMLNNHIDGLELSKATGYWSDDDERTLNLMYLIKDILSNIKEEDDWIPCTPETMPNNDDAVLITHSHGVTKAWWNGRYWTNGMTKKFKTVIAWKKMPEPYKKEEDKNEPDKQTN